VFSANAGQLADSDDVDAELGRLDDPNENALKRKKMGDEEEPEERQYKKIAKIIEAKQVQKRAKKEEELTKRMALFTANLQ
jgi:hypothetical protein